MTDYALLDIFNNSIKYSSKSMYDIISHIYYKKIDISTINIGVLFHGEIKSIFIIELKEKRFVLKDIGTNQNIILNSLFPDICIFENIINIGIKEENYENSSNKFINDELTEQNNLFKNINDSTICCTLDKTHDTLFQAIPEIFDETVEKNKGFNKINMKEFESGKKCFMDIYKEVNSNGFDVHPNYVETYVILESMMENELINFDNNDNIDEEFKIYKEMENELFNEL